MLMLNNGMHPGNLRLLSAVRGKPKGDCVTDMGILQYERVKTYKPVQVLLPEQWRELIFKSVKSRKLAVSNQYYEQVFAEMGKILPEYPTPPVSPMTLRHTYVLSQLRHYKEKGGVPDIRMVAARAMCHINTVTSNYIDLEDWERMYDRDQAELSLDISTFSLRTSAVPYSVL
ncbi:MAG: hypothetical protein UY48_C0044G0007 [Candidatus Gottesmanbacteria bacterium GW2011_GWB1_49_7]|uniref:Tyr recombinase domain-containing protein n=1 Tax=Candidatus Gottesmanbacteria bacterium GW2011_GWB1_49_7 TaxID=1618448 RepID=A0A0G1VUQ9_9BACT|nr:MAG: hypothetical protein UY48_C0044G0007 [Candidatus Gottesmanbacteria bacterium GW2011_GWB1_49_7]